MERGPSDQDKGRPIYPQSKLGWKLGTSYHHDRYVNYSRSQHEKLFSRIPNRTNGKAKDSNRSSPNERDPFSPRFAPYAPRSEWVRFIKNKDLNYPTSIRLAIPQYRQKNWMDTKNRMQTDEIPSINRKRTWVDNEGWTHIVRKHRIPEVLSLGTIQKDHMPELWEAGSFHKGMH